MDQQGCNFIGGDFVPASEGRTFARANPSHAHQALGVSAQSTAADVHLAVAAARAALPAWRALAGPARGRQLLAAADALARATDLADLVAAEVGKPIGEARGEVARGVALLRYYAAETERATGENLPAPDGRSLLLTRRIPLGVVGLITPWNFPVAIPLWKAAPAWAFGNTVVWKPASWASLIAHRLAQILAEALPAGVCNVVTGAGSVIGNALAAHPDVAAISFTGSEAVGRGLGATLAARGVKFQGELGGKNPAIVLADADLELAAATTLSGAFRFAGQKCTATSRVIVEEAVRQPFVDLLADRARALVPLPAEDEACFLGPVVSAGQADEVRTAITRAQADGARLVAGGEGTPPGRDDGHYIAATVLDRVRPDSALAQDEIFGPVLAVLAAPDAQAAFRLANDTRYGLSASVFTNRIDRALAYINEIEVGMVRINAETTGVDYLAPFGGLKASSSHSREQGRAAVEFYTETQTITISPPR